MSRNDDVASWLALRPSDQTEASGGWFGPLDGIHQWWDRTGSMFQCNVPEQIQVCNTTQVKPSVAHSHIRNPPFSWQPEPREAAPRRAMDSFASPRLPPPNAQLARPGLSANHEMKILMMGRDGYDVNHHPGAGSPGFEFVPSPTWKDSADAPSGSGRQNPVHTSEHDTEQGLQWENKLLFDSQQSLKSKYTKAYMPPPQAPQGIGFKLPEAQAFESFTVSRADHGRLPQRQVTPRYHRLDQPDDVQDSNPQMTIPEHEYVSPLPTREYDSPKSSRASYSWQAESRTPSQAESRTPSQPKVLTTKIAGMNLDGSFKIEVDLVELASTPRESPQHLQVV